MIIGVSGKKQHGKDTVIRMINWICASIEIGEERLPSMQAYVLDHAENITSDWKGAWEFKKYADKLKDILCMLSGCTREQLEDEDFKNSFMPVEWNKKVYGSYASNFGKITQTEETYSKNPKFYCIEYDVEDKSEANRRQKDALLFFNEQIDYFEPLNYRDRKYCIQERRTYRDALQFIGTDLFRKQFNDNTWVDATMADYKGVSVPDGLGGEYIKYPNWLISDTRFPNEVKAIKDRNGLLIRINRPSVVSTDKHESETALDGYEGFDLIITNNDDLDEIYQILLPFVKTYIYGQKN